MRSFPLKIVTPDGLIFDGQAEQLIVRTTSGDMGILAGHVNCVAPLGMGLATVIADGKKRYGACIGGMVSVLNGQVKLVPTTFEWAEDIDVERAKSAKARAEEKLKKSDLSEREIKIAQAKINRALVRSSVAANVK